jgi:tellurite resistance protein TerC
MTMMTLMTMICGLILEPCCLSTSAGCGGDHRGRVGDLVPPRLLGRLMPVTDEYHGDDFFVKRDGKRCATPLLAALVVVEASDILFAIDSVPAVLSVTQTAFVAYSSIVFAVLGLRALYFALEGLIDRFVYLHYGLAVILVFVGGKFVAQGFGVQVPIITSLLVILVAIVASVAVSLGATRGNKPGEA